MARDSLIVLLQNLGLVINLKKSVLDPVKQIEFLRLHIHAEKMTLSLSQEKSQKSQEIIFQPKTSIVTLRKLVEFLFWTVQAV